jgi:hypothetical protein
MYDVGTGLAPVHKVFISDRTNLMCVVGTGLDPVRFKYGFMTR